MNVRETQLPRRDLKTRSQNAEAQGIPPALGSYDAEGKFKFNSERDRMNWLRKGYRQGINPDTFERGAPLHPDEAAAYASGAVEPPHHAFQGPDGRFRGKNAATREKPEIHETRMRSWEGIRFKDVDPHAEKHLGEDEALELMMGAAAPEMSDTASQSKPRMGMLKGIPLLTGAPYSGIVPAASSDGKGGGIAAAVGAIGGGSKPALLPNTNPSFSQRPQSQQAAPSRWQPPIPGSGAPPAAQGIRSKPPYERTPQDLSEPQVQTGRTPSAGTSLGIDLPRQMPGDRGVAEQDWIEAEKWEGWPLNMLPRSNHQRTPESVVHGVLLDEGLSIRLSEIKKEWAALKKENPEAVENDKEDAARQLVMMASDELFAYQKDPPSDEQIAEMMRTAQEIVNRPYRDGEEFAGLPEFRRLPLKPNVDELARYIEQSLTEKIEEEERAGGRPGGLQSRKDIRRITEKLSEALKRCGAVIKDVRFGNREKQVRRNPDTALGSRYPDIEVEFQLENGGAYSLGDIMSLYASHFTNLKDGSMNARERGQFFGLEENLRKEIVGPRAKRFYSSALEQIRKRGKQETDEDYFKVVDEWIKKIIDCGKITFVNIKVKKNPNDMKPANSAPAPQ